MCLNTTSTQHLTDLSQYISQIFVEKRPLDTIGVNLAAKLIETLGLSVFLTWWGTRTNPFE